MSNAVAETWNEAATIPNFRKRFLASLQFAREYQHQLYLNGRSPFALLSETLRSMKSPRVLELAGGRGDFAMALLEAGVAESVHMVDISDGALAVARDRADKRGLEGLSLELGDINEYRISESYDVVAFSQSLHHIENLEGILGSAAACLENTGLLYVNDYVGPSRMQWTDTQMTIMNEILGNLPESRRKKLARDGTPTDVAKDAVRRTAIETYLAVDPSEGVRSAEIDGVIRDCFSDVEKFPTGGTISYELFRLIAHNFDDGEDGMSMVKLIMFFEKTLIDAGVLESDFAVYLARV